MPTAATTTFTEDCIDPVYPDVPAPMQNVKLSDGTYAKGTVLGELTATPGTFAAYADANVDGTGVAKAILKYAVVVASGLVTIGTASGGGPFGQTKTHAPVYFGGAFRTSELTGFDAAALADLNGHLANGSVSSGILVF